MSSSTLLTGYGHSATAAQGIPMFDGQRAHFSDFAFKAKCVIIDLGVATVLDATAYRAALDAATARDEQRSQARTRGQTAELSSIAGPTLEEVRGWDSRVGRLLVTRLTEKVVTTMRKAIGDDEALKGPPPLFLHKHQGICAQNQMENG